MFHMDYDYYYFFFVHDQGETIGGKRIITIYKQIGYGLFDINYCSRIYEKRILKNLHNRYQLLKTKYSEAYKI